MRDFKNEGNHFNKKEIYTSTTKKKSLSEEKRKKQARKPDVGEEAEGFHIEKSNTKKLRQTRADKAELLKKHFPEIKFDDVLDSIVNVVEGKDSLSMSFAGSYLMAKFKECKMFLCDRNFTMERIAQKIKDIRRHFKQKSLAASIASVRNPDKKNGVINPIPPNVAVNVSEFWMRKKYSVNVGKEGVWVALDNGDTILDCDRELHVFTVDMDQATIDAILTKAEEKWNRRIEISGDKTFKQKLYHAAIQRGIEVVGYDGGVGFVKEPTENNPSPAVATPQASSSSGKDDVKKPEKVVKENNTSSSLSALQFDDDVNLDNDDDFLDIHVVE